MRFPRVKAEIDDLDLAGSTRIGRLLQGLVDHGAVGIGIVNTEHRHRFVVFGQLVDQVGAQRRRPSPDQAEHPTNDPPHYTAA